MTHILHYDIYKQADDKPVVVLVHGYLSSSRYFRRTVNDLARDFTVVTVDLLGHGKTAKLAADADDFSLEAQSRALHDTLQSLNITRPFYLLGHSMGGLIALQHTVDHPGDIAKLILLNPAMFAGQKEAMQSILATGRAYRALMFSRHRRKLWQVARLLPRRKNPRRPVGLSDMLVVPHEVRDSALQTIMHSNFFTLAQKITAPTLLILGQRDRAIYHTNLARHPLGGNITVSKNPYGHHYLKYQFSEAIAQIRSFFTA